MYKLSRYRSGKGRVDRQIAINVALRLLLLLTCNFVAVAGCRVGAQPKSTATKISSSLCNRNNALEMIREQIEVSRTFDDAVRRSVVLVRAADLLWAFQQDKARAAFTEAFHVAVRNEKEKSAQPKTNRSLLMESPDQRFLVIGAIAKRDAAWAKELTQQMLKVDRQSAEQAITRDSFNDILTGQRLLDSAAQLIPANTGTAIDLARVSLNYPATFMMSRFLYKLSQVDQPAADRFYDQALTVYADRPMREFLYLATYPFAFRESGDTPVFGFYYDAVPANFVTNNSLQRRFVQTLLRRAQKALEVSLDEGDNFNRLPGTGHIVQVLMRVEPRVRDLLPDLLEATIQAREKLLVSLSADTQTKLRPDQDEASSSPPTFAERIETAEKTPNVNRREELIVGAVLDVSTEPLEGVLRALEQISDANLRTTLVEWLYFKRAKDATRDKRFDEAEQLMTKVEGRELRAYLHIEIAKGLLNASETQTHGREVLDEAITEANKGGPTIFTAKTLLTASVLYAKMDLSKSIAILGDAINYINHLDAADFSAGDQTLAKTFKRKTPGHYIIRFYMPGLDPENAFREIAKTDFDDALSQTSALIDKFHRALTTFAVADVCLQQVSKAPKKKAKS